LRFDATEAGPLHGTVYWQVLEPERAEAVIDQADQLIRRNVLDALRADGAASQEEGRREVAARLKSSLNQCLRERGVMVTRVELEAA
jgi:flagellar basal body-associated protein FliL